MAAVFDKPSLFQRSLPLLQGFDGLLAFAVFLLASAGMLIMYSSGYDSGTRFADHGRNMLIAGGIMFVVAQIPPQRLMALAVPLYIVGVSLLVAVAIFGITKKGARRWLYVGVVIQPSEIMKIAMPLMLAWWFQKREGQLRPLDFIAALLLLAVPVGLIMKQPDLGTSLLVLAAGLAVIFFAGLSWKLILPPVLMGLVAVFLVVWFEPQLCADGMRWPVLHDYQQQRICTLLDPSRDPLGKGFHIIQGMIAIGSGGVFGKGFMAGTQTHLEFIPERTTDFIFAAYSEEFGLVGNLLLIAIGSGGVFGKGFMAGTQTHLEFIPERTTDFIFAAYSEEFGLVGNLLLIAAFIFLILRGLAIALEAPTLFSRLLAGALTMIFFTYAFVNMGMVSGILPVVGVPLPFISYGGTAMVTLGLAVGMLMSIAKAKRLVQT